MRTRTMARISMRILEMMLGRLWGDMLGIGMLVVLSPSPVPARIQNRMTRTLK